MALNPSGAWSDISGTNNEEEEDDTNSSGQSAGESTGISGPAGAVSEPINDGADAIQNTVESSTSALGSAWSGVSKNLQRKAETEGSPESDNTSTNGPSDLEGNNTTGPIAEKQNDSDSTQVDKTYETEADGNISPQNEAFQEQVQSAGSSKTPNIDQDFYLQSVAQARAEGNPGGGEEKYGPDDPIGLGGRERHRGGRFYGLYEDFKEAGLDPYAPSNRGILDTDGDGIDDRVEFAENPEDAPSKGVIEQGMEMMGLKTQDNYRMKDEDGALNPSNIVKRGTESQDESRSTAGSGGPGDKPGGNTKSGSDPNRPTDDRGRGPGFSTRGTGGSRSRSALSQGARFGGEGSGIPSNRQSSEPDKQMSGGVIGTVRSNPVKTTAGVAVAGGLGYLLLSIVGVL